MEMIWTHGFSYAPSQFIMTKGCSMHDQRNGDRCVANKRTEAGTDEAVAHLESNTEITKQVLHAKTGVEIVESCPHWATRAGPACRQRLAMITILLSLFRPPYMTFFNEYQFLRKFAVGGVHHR